jgi:Sap, sulfolipid-1-addressing protein
MLKLAVAVVAIALADSVNPSLIGGELFVATGEHPRRQTTAFTAAALVVTFTFGVRARARAWGPDSVAGAEAGPYRQVRADRVRRDRPRRRRCRRLDPPQDAGEHQAERGSPGAPSARCADGAGIAGVELLTAFPYFAAIAMIVGSGVSDVGKLSLLVLYCVIYTLPLIAIAVVIAIMGERAEGILGPAGGWLSGHWPVVVAPLTAAFGIGVLAFGIVQLTST